MALTNKQYRKSDEAEEAVCPFCRSNELEWDELTVNGRTVKQEVKCLDCENEWYDIYKLKGYVER